jgi:hypothetical protein
MPAGLRGAARPREHPFRKRRGLAHAIRSPESTNELIRSGRFKIDQNLTLAAAAQILAMHSGAKQFAAQLLTLFTTPVVYLYLDRLSTFLRRKKNGAMKQDAAASPLK